MSYVHGGKMIIEDEILILKEVKYKDNDKILHALSKKNGKIQILSRGCRKSKSSLINISQIMAYSRCQLYDSKDMYILNSGELIDNFYNIRSKITAFLHGSYVLELLGYISQENEIDGKAFDMTIRLFQILNDIEEDEIKIENIISIYELKLISILGYRPQLKECIICGEKLNKNSSYVLNIKDGGIQCVECMERLIASQRVNSNTNFVNINNNIGKIDISYIVLLNNMLVSKLDDSDIISEINDKIRILIKNYLFYHIGKSDFTTLKLLRKGI